MLWLGSFKREEKRLKQVVMDFGPILHDIYNRIKNNWYRVSSLLLLLGLIAVFLLWVFSAIDFSKINYYQYAIAGLILILATIVWWVTTRPYKSPPKKVGFGVALVTESREQREKLYHDFIVSLRTLLSKSKYRYKFAFHVYPQHFAEKIESSDDARKFMKDARLRFLIYGRVRNRIVNDKETHILQLDGVVAHRPIDPEFQKQFSAEFSELFPRRMQLVKENDTLSFELGADLVRIVSMYIISIASLISGDVQYATDLLETLNHDLKATELIGLPALTKIRSRVRARLIDVYEIQSLSYTAAWAKTRDLETMKKVGPFLDKLQEIDPRNFEGHVRRALWIFVTQGDVAAARKEIQKCTTAHESVAWRYSAAFLWAYEGELEKAVSEYREAFKGQIEPPVLQYILEFIDWSAEREPEKYQLFFCIGLIHYKVTQNYLRAHEAFTDFLNSLTDNQFHRQKQQAEKYIVQIKKKDQRIV